MNYAKYFNKKVIVSQDGSLFGKTGVLINVTPSEWGFGKNKIAHVVVGERAIVVPIEKIILLKEEE